MLTEHSPSWRAPVKYGPLCWVMESPNRKNWSSREAWCCSDQKHPSTGASWALGLLTIARDDAQVRNALVGLERVG